MTGRTLDPPEATPPHYLWQWRALLDAMAASSNPNTSAWAVSLVKLLAERRHLRILLGTLQWAIQELSVPRPLNRIRNEVERAFDIAQSIDVEASSVLLANEEVRP